MSLIWAKAQMPDDTLWMIQWWLVSKSGNCCVVCGKWLVIFLGFFFFVLKLPFFHVYVCLVIHWFSRLSLINFFIVYVFSWPFLIIKGLSWYWWYYPVTLRCGEVSLKTDFFFLVSLDTIFFSLFFLTLLWSHPMPHGANNILIRNSNFTWFLHWWFT